LINEPLLAQIFAALRKEFDYVIVDCPPLPTVVDTMTLANYAD
jgi:Mrp family chromosome partitioning ATPase